MDKDGKPKMRTASTPKGMNKGAAWEAIRSFGRNMKDDVIDYFRSDGGRYGETNPAINAQTTNPTTPTNNSSNITSSSGKDIDNYSTTNQNPQPKEVIKETNAKNWATEQDLKAVGEAPTHTNVKTNTLNERLKAREYVKSLE